MKTCIIILLFTFTHLWSFGQIKFNNVDTISSPNKELINFFRDYIDFRAKGNPATAYLSQTETPLKISHDLNEQWDQYYPWLKHYGAIILGLSKVDSNSYKIKLSIETGLDSSSMMLFSIQDYLIQRTEHGYKLGSILNFNLRKYKYVHFTGKYFDYYYPEGTHKEDIPISQQEQLIERLEKYFGRQLPFKFNYIHSNSCEDLYRLRGIDYVANMMSTKTTVCGWTYANQKIMYSSHSGYHKHEILRLISVFNPKAPLIIADGITNLTGGSVGKPIKYHIQKLAPYLAQHPQKLEKIEDFWYYDDETNPYFVFHALIVNHLLKTKGKKVFRDMLLSDNQAPISIREFVLKHFQEKDVKDFFLKQLNHYAKSNNELEFVNFF